MNVAGTIQQHPGARRARRFSPPWRGPRTDGFTLIEMLAVLILISLLSTLAVVRLTGKLHSTDFADVLQQVVDRDHQLREKAKQSGATTAATFQVGSTRVINLGAAPATPLKLPRGFEVKRVMLPGGRVDYGPATIRYSSQGYSSSYAVLVNGPENRSEWIVVAGLTGLSVQVRDEREVDTIFKSLAPAGRDAR